MSALLTYRAAVRHAEQERIREREASGKCIACGTAEPVEGSMLCATHRSALDRHKAAQHADARDLTEPVPSSRRRGAP